MRIPSTRSIILIGSHAIGSADNNISDFDIAIVLKTILVPIYYLQLKKIEKEVSTRFNCKISIGPLPTFWLKSARNNYFLYKLSKRGVVLWGEDVRPYIGKFWITDAALVSYLSFLAKELIGNCETLFRGTGTEDWRRVLYIVKKVFMGCTEASLLMNGIYEDRPSKIFDFIKKDESSISKSLANDLMHFIDCSNDSCQDANVLWFQTRDHVLGLLTIVLKRIYDVDTNSHIMFNQLAFHYVQKSKFSIMRNLQYLILSVLNRKKLNLNYVFTTKMITSILYASTIMLLDSIQQNGIKKESLLAVYKLLGVESNHLNEMTNINMWFSIRNYILDIWELIDVHMGFN